MQPFSDNVLDWDHGNEEKDLDAIARTMVDWEIRFAVKLGLTPPEIEEIKVKTTPSNQRLAHVHCDKCRQ